MIASNLAKSMEIAMPPAPRGVEWLEIGEAKDRSGIPARTLRERCPGWFAAGLAKMEKPAEGGKARWLIREDADPRLARHPRGDEVRPNESVILGLKPAQREAMVREEDFLKRADEARAAAVRAGIGAVQGLKNFCEREGRGSYSTFRRKWAAWRKHGIQGLLDGRALSKREKREDERMLQEAARFYLDGTEPTPAECFRAAKEKAIQEGWLVWGKTSVDKHLDKIPLPEATFKREGMDVFKNKCEPTLQRTRAHIMSDQIWEWDGMTLDQICLLGEKTDPKTGEIVPILGRPEASTWIDIGSNKVLISRVVGTAIDNGIIWGDFRKVALELDRVPWAVRTDNGKNADHSDMTGETKAQRRLRRRENPDSEAPQEGMLALLGIKHYHTTPYLARPKLDFCRFLGISYEGRRISKDRTRADIRW